MCGCFGQAGSGKPHGLVPAPSATSPSETTGRCTPGAMSTVGAGAATEMGAGAAADDDAARAPRRSRSAKEKRAIPW